MRKFSKGLTLIELLIYLALLSSVLLVTYDLFVQVNLDRVSASATNSIYLNAQRVFLDFSQTIRKSQNIILPIYKGNGTILSLNGGEIIYQVDDQKRLVKKEAGGIDNLTDGGVLVDSLVFETLGPSTVQPIIKINLVLESVERNRKITFQMSVAKR